MTLSSLRCLLAWFPDQRRAMISHLWVRSRIVESRAIHILNSRRVMPRREPVVAYIHGEGCRHFPSAGAALAYLGEHRQGRYAHIATENRTILESFPSAEVLEMDGFAKRITTRSMEDTHV